MDLRDIEKAARDQGWRVERNRKGHPVFYPVDESKPAIVGSGTPSDRRAILNLLSRLKAAGLQWPWASRDRRQRRRN